MIVDDDDLVLQDLKTLVNWEVLGFQIVAEAHNGKKALELLKKSKPDLIICDIAMPVMDGLDFIDTLYQSKASVYTVIISAYENFQYAKRAMQNGISDYILKNELSGELLTQKLEQVKLDRKSVV